MAEQTFDLCPPLPSDQGVGRGHWQTPRDMGYRSAYPMQEADAWSARFVWPTADVGYIKRARVLWSLTLEGALPMDFTFQLDGVTREVLFDGPPFIDLSSAYGGRLEVSLVEAR